MTKFTLETHHHYPTSTPSLGFLMWDIPEKRKATSFEGASVIFGVKHKRAPKGHG